MSKELKEQLPENLQAMLHEDTLFCADQPVEAIVGVLEPNPAAAVTIPVLVYDSDRMIEELIEQGMSDYEEASEYLAFNTWGAWVGPGTPYFVISNPAEDTSHELYEEITGNTPDENFLGIGIRCASPDLALVKKGAKIENDFIGYVTLR